MIFVYKKDGSHHYSTSLPMGAVETHQVHDNTIATFLNGALTILTPDGRGLFGGISPSGTRYNLRDLVGSGIPLKQHYQCHNCGVTYDSQSELDICECSGNWRCDATGHISGDASQKAEIVINGETVKFNITKTAYMTCDCGEHYWRHTVSDPSMCDECFVAQNPSCDNCGDADTVDNMVVFGDSKYCGKCQAAGYPIEYEINKWSFKPTPHFYRINEIIKRTKFYGVELELYNTGDTSNELAANKLLVGLRVAHPKAKDMFYIKSDSSIGNGFEVVSHPFSQKWLAANSDVFDELFRIAGTIGLKAGNKNGVTSCGMHVHISTKPMTRSDVFKYTAFTYLNKSDVIRISGRGSGSEVEQFANFPSTSSFGMLEFKKVGQAKSNVCGLGHHNALQFTPHTMEFRVFDGVSDMETFIVNMEYIFATLEFTKVRPRELTMYGFVNVFLETNREKYQKLYTYINSLSLKKKQSYGIRKKTVVTW